MHVNSCIFRVQYRLPVTVRTTPGLRLFLRLLSRSRFRPSRGRCGCVVGFGWMVVRFVRVIRVPACARVSRVSRVCPGSPRCLFTGPVRACVLSVDEI